MGSLCTRRYITARHPRPINGIFVAITVMNWTFYVERQSRHLDQGSSDVLGIDCRLDQAQTTFRETECRII